MQQCCQFLFEIRNLQHTGCTAENSQKIVYCGMLRCNNFNPSIKQQKIFKENHQRKSTTLTRPLNFTTTTTDWRQSNFLLSGHSLHRSFCFYSKSVMVVTSCRFTMQFVGYDYIETHWLVSHRFEIHTLTKRKYKEVGQTNCIL